MRDNNDLEYTKNDDGVIIPKKATYGYLTGVFTEGGVVGGNGVHYNQTSLDAACEEYIRTRVRTNKAVGEIDHQKEHAKDKGYDPRVKLSRKPCIRVIDLKKQGSKWIGKALILDNEHGKELYDLAKPTSGVVPGISMRVNYDVGSDGEAINIYIICFDVVLNSGIESATEQTIVGESARSVRIGKGKRYFGNGEKVVRGEDIDLSKAFAKIVCNTGRKVL